MIAFVFLSILLYVLFGILFYVFKDMLSENYDLPDLGDLIHGRLEPEEQNRIVLFITFWPVIVIFYLVKFIFIAVKAIYNAIVWYAKGLISSFQQRKQIK